MTDEKHTDIPVMHPGLIDPNWKEIGLDGSPGAALIIIIMKIERNIKIQITQLYKALVRKVNKFFFFFKLQCDHIKIFSNIPLVGVEGAAASEFMVGGLGVGAFGITPVLFCTDESSDDLAAFATDK